MIRLKSHQPRSGFLSPEEFESLTSASIQLEMADYVEDSWVDEVWMPPEVSMEIYDWGRQSLSGDPNKVPEVGGFLLGSYTQRATHWSVWIQSFVPAREVDFQSQVQLEFGTKVLDDLSQVMEQKKDQALVGWFHTHPGHTPYLSETDLQYTHIPYFPKPYHLAIVMDVLTEAFDTGLFTWRRDGKMNNKAHFRSWIPWKSMIGERD